MTRSFRPALLIGLLAAALAGCSIPATRANFPDIRFSDRPPMALDVATIAVENTFSPSFHEPNVEHLFPVPPARAAENWARDRLRATGSKGRARVIIEDASVIETQLKKKSEGLTAAFTTEPAQRYDARIALRVDVLDEHGIVVRSATANATRSQGALEGVTLNERDQIWYDMTKALMDQLDHEIERQMRDKFGYYLQ